MDKPLAPAENGSIIATQNYLQELLNLATELQTNVSAKQREKDNASEDLDAVSSKVYDAIASVTEWKRRQILAPKPQLNDIRHDFVAENGKTSFSDQFKQLQQTMGISLDCSPEQKHVRITYDDVHKTTVSFTYGDKGIALKEMHPTPDNMEAIQTNLRETGDLIGFLSVLRTKLRTTDV